MKIDSNRRVYFGLLLSTHLVENQDKFYMILVI